MNPVNRRISIIVMNKEAEEAAQKDGGTVQVDAEKDDPQQQMSATSGVLPVSAAAIAAPKTPLPLVPKPVQADH
jgi:chemotaxis protein MotB